MAGEANVIEEGVQLVDDGRDLLRQVARVHVESCSQGACM